MFGSACSFSVLTGSLFRLVSCLCCDAGSGVCGVLVIAIVVDLAAVDTGYLWHDCVYCIRALAQTC